ncbi:MAG: hypothetical protein ACI8QZ_002448 [Chlamydiales bacterium]|jgi:hypothetical protein
MSGGGKFAWGVVLVAAVLHFDFWAWDDDTLVFGFIPMALAYHAACSLVAAIAWALVVRFDWPEGIEEWAKQAPDAAQEGGQSHDDPH